MRTRAATSLLLTCLMATCAAGVGAVTIPARAQSPAEALRSIRESARNSLIREHEGASQALGRLRANAERALVGWLRRGNGPPSKKPVSKESSREGASPVAISTTDSVMETSTKEASTSGISTMEISSTEKTSPADKATARAGGGDDTPGDDAPRDDALGNEATEKRPAASSGVPTPRRRAAAPHRPLINQFARRRGLPRTLVYAIADAESFFNAGAVSSAGAIGLMQVHPPTGGRLAWAAVHGEPETPSKEHLTTPENNVRLGTKLLELLLRDFFGGVHKEWSRQLLATASYNAGASRVAEGLTERGTIGAAVALANKLSPQGIYERLRRTAPPETQTYVQRVFHRREHYAPWRGEDEVVYGVPGRTSSK